MVASQSILKKIKKFYFVFIKLLIPYFRTLIIDHLVHYESCPNDFRHRFEILKQMHVHTTSVSAKQLASMTCLVGRVVKNNSFADRNPARLSSVHANFTKIHNFLKHFLAHYCCVNATVMQVYSFRYFKGHKGCISQDRQRKCQQMHFFESQNILVVSSWSLVDFRSLIGTDDVPPLVVSPRVRQFPRIDISGSASSSERKVDVGGARCSRQEQHRTRFFF